MHIKQREESNITMFLSIKKIEKRNPENAAKNALAGNRTRAARVAGEHSTTEPPVLLILSTRCTWTQLVHIAIGNIFVPTCGFI